MSRLAPSFDFVTIHPRRPEIFEVKVESNFTVFFAAIGTTTWTPDQRWTHSHPLSRLLKYFFWFWSTDKCPGLLPALILWQSNHWGQRYLRSDLNLISLILRGHRDDDLDAGSKMDSFTPFRTTFGIFFDFDQQINVQACFLLWFCDNPPTEARDIWGQSWIKAFLFIFTTIFLCDYYVQGGFLVMDRKACFSTKTCHDWYHLSCF